MPDVILRFPNHRTYRGGLSVPTLPPRRTSTYPTPRGTDVIIPLHIEQALRLFALSPFFVLTTGHTGRRNETAGQKAEEALAEWDWKA